MERMERTVGDYRARVGAVGFYSQMFAFAMLQRIQGGGSS